VIVAHRWPGEALPALLLARPNRFLALCRLGRRTVEAHVPDRGRCLDLLVPGRAVALVAVPSGLASDVVSGLASGLRPQASGLGPEARRTQFTAILAQSSEGTWVSLDPAGAPRLVEEALRRNLLPSLAGLQVIRREVAIRSRRFSGRIDLLLAPEARGPRPEAPSARLQASSTMLHPTGPQAANSTLCEVKSVGAQRDGVALFPDAPTLRGARHLGLLAALSRKGARCALVFCAQRGDVRAVAPDVAIDPQFAAALRRAIKAGVRIAALRCAAELSGMELHGEIPVLLS
jgi:sugar fermentation stimulation protein A